MNISYQAHLDSLTIQTDRPELEDRGFTYEGEDGGDPIWTKVVSIKRHTARKDHTFAGGRVVTIRKGQTYRRVTTMNIDDATGNKWMTHTKRVIQ